MDGGYATRIVKALHSVVEILKAVVKELDKRIVYIRKESL